MSPLWNRRDVLKGLVSASAINTKLIKSVADRSSIGSPAGQIELQVAPVSRCTFRLTLFQGQDGRVETIPTDGSLVQQSWGEPVAKLRSETDHAVSVGDARLKISSNPVSLAIADARGHEVQQLRWDGDTGTVSFQIGEAPLFGLGEGGQQFDRRGSVDVTKNGQSGYKLATHGARVAIPWIIGTQGWAIFFHRPYGTFDLRGSEGKF